MADGRARYPKPSADLAVVHACSDQFEGSTAKFQVVHGERMFPSAADGSACAGCYPDARPAAIV
jgi:hypothetical protein